MECRKLNLREINPRLPETENPAVLQVMLHDNCPRTMQGEDTRRPVIIVMPGGAYAYTSPREADPVAIPFFAAGFQVLTLHYSCKPDRYPAALLQAAATVAWVRENAEELHADPKNIYVCGFSAGGHAAGSISILWNEPVIHETLGIDNRLCRPDGMILGYPVITAGEFAHRGSLNNLLGEGQPEEVYQKLSLELRVDDTTPPAFLWHTWEDMLPVENTLLLANALRAHKIPFELHIYPFGAHGLATSDAITNRPDELGPDEQYDRTWLYAAGKWLQRMLLDE